MRINQVAKKFNVPEHTLRYWEAVQIISTVNKDSQGYREYTSRDINQIKFAILMRNSGVGIKLLTKYMKLLRVGPKTNPLRKNILVRQLHIINKRIKVLNNSKQQLISKLKQFPHVKDVYRYELTHQSNVKYLRNRKGDQQ